MRQLLARTLVAAIRLRRRTRGPIRDDWSVELETLARTLHHYGKRSHRLPLAWQRRALGAFPSAPDSRVSVTRVDAGGVPAVWITPERAAHDAVLVYLHGGGYSIGGIRSHQAFVSKLARLAGMRALLPDYRLAPEHPYPAQLRDARSVWRYVLESGVDPTRTVIAGESAGGGLTMSTLLSLRDDAQPLPAGAAVLSPWVDLTLSGVSIDGNARFDYLARPTLETYVSRFARDGDRRHPLVSPVFGDLRGLPPLLVQVGEAEALLDDARTLVARAHDAGVDVELSEYADMIHAFQLFPGLPAARVAVDELVAFVRAKTGMDAPAGG